MPLTEAEELELLELEEAEASAQPKGLVDKINEAINPYGMSINPGAPQKDSKPVMGTPFDNPLFAGSSAAAKSVVGALGGLLGRGAQGVATSPVPQRLASMADKVAPGKGLIGRALAYTNPYTAYPQAAADASKLAVGAQGLLGRVLDSGVGGVLRRGGEAAYQGGATVNALDEIVKKVAGKK
jgi:hypothetical protein